ncbi:uncharacterized protein LOC123987843 [Osmia bicornis bicornis]|uniref:uncharacterized protein LOC123987843 n=1 Tax=Osmia bicornis bicornis TaxID=1437191 RepID=UPI001EAF4556|nr:uncharacterized protein LOC123987843 [Osmia bicornis bicornis]
MDSDSNSYGFEKRLEIFQKFLETCTNTFRLNKEHVNEKVWLKVQKDIVHVNTESGANYQLANIEFDPEEWKLIKRVIITETVGEQGIEMPRTEIQQENAENISEEIGMELLSDEVNDKEEVNQKDVTDVKSDGKLDRSKDGKKDDVQSMGVIKSTVNTLCTTVSNMMSCWKEHVVSTGNAISNIEATNKENDAKLSKLEDSVRTLTELLKTIRQEKTGKKIDEESQSLSKNKAVEFNSVVSGDESNSVDEKIALAVRKELEKLNAKSTSGTTKSLADEFRDTIKFELVSKESGVKRDYKLTSHMKLEHIYDYFSSELRMHDLLYVVDTKSVLLAGA